MKATIVWQWNWDAIHAMNENGERKYRYIINEGSSRSSKTYSLIDCYDLYAKSNENKRLTVWRDTKTDCKKTVLHDTIKHLKLTGRWKVGFEFNKTESIITYWTGSTFEVHGTDDEETVHGLTQQAAWLNEPYKISRDTFDQIDQRTDDFIFLDWNPKKAHWIEDLKKDERALVIKSTFKHNPFCPPEQKAKILSYQPVSRSEAVESNLLFMQECYSYDFIANPKSLTEKQINELKRCLLNEEKNSASEWKWSVYGLGEKAEKPNRIFHWKKISPNDYAKINAKKYIGVDWGSQDPFGIVEAKYYDGKLYLHELNYASENEIKSKLSATEWAQVNSYEEGLVTWLFDRLNISKKDIIICDDNRPTKRNALVNAGYDYAIKASKGQDSIMHGIEILNSLDVYYTSSSKNLEYEQENYSYIVDKYGNTTEMPNDVDNHLCDPVRYIAKFMQQEGIIKNI